MNDYRAKADSIQSPPAILCECRELMTDLLRQSLPNMMNEVDDVLLDIAVRTTNSQERTKYFNATHEVRLMRHDIEQKCIENYVELFSENLSSDIYEMKDIGGAKDISIVAMENATNKVRNNCRQALLNLDRQMSNVLKNCDMETKKNPLTPEIVCKAFYNACELIDSGMEIRLIIFKKFEKTILPLLNDVYLEINHILSGGSSSMESQQTSTAVDRGEGFQSIADVKQTVTSEIQNLLTDQHVPDFVSEFLLDQWAKLLVRIHNKNGMKSDSWRHARETAEDLIWSVGSLSSKQDKDRLDKLWPDLVLHLRNGMKMISMPPHQVNNFISSLLKHRATLTMLAALTQSKKNDGDLINPEKIKAMNKKIKSDSGQVMAREKELDSTGSEDKTMPALKKHSGKRPSLSDSLPNYLDKETDFDSVIDEDIKISGPKKDIDDRPFMDELFVENFNIKGFKTDITGG
jgi:hypothetical protein